MRGLTRYATATDARYKKNDFPMRRGMKVAPLKWYFLTFKDTHRLFGFTG